MRNRSLLRSALFSAAFLLCFYAPPVRADLSHARIVRLSLVQGDVRFARDVKGDPLADNNIAWERADLNLPIRQGYVLATDSGRAEVEFENGAMAFLAENTVLEFYDLSLEDGGRTTRLILRQGTAEFYVNPARGDFFSVTGGDFSVEAQGKATFRLDNFDDGSDVNVSHGHVSVLAKDKTTELEKGQSLAMRAGDLDSITVSRSPNNDEFDQWVSGRIDSVATASNAALQYSNSYDYTSGFGDLYTYGSWFPVAGYGYCWRPYGVGFGWSPFDFGNWYYDPFFGWAFIGSQPWGWLPYHYGGWIFQPGFGWVWNPGGSFLGGRPGRPVRWRPVTAVFVRSGGALGIVPAHPMDAGRKTPLNLAQGVFPVTERGVSGRAPVADGEIWKVERRPSRTAIATTVTPVGPPARFSRTIVAESPVPHNAGAGRASSIVYDPAERRFVNSNANSPRSTEIREGIQHTVTTGNANADSASPAATPTRAGSNRVVTNDANRAATPPPARTATPPSARSATPPRPSATPPPAPRGGSPERSSSGPRWGGNSSSGSSGGSMPRSSGGGARPAPSPSGGRPH